MPKKRIKTRLLPPDHPIFSSGWTLTSQIASARPTVAGPKKATEKPQEPPDRLSKEDQELLWQISLDKLKDMNDDRNSEEPS